MRDDMYDDTGWVIEYPQPLTKNEASKMETAGALAQRREVTSDFWENNGAQNRRLILLKY